MANLFFVGAARKSAKARNATGNPESQSVPLDPDYWEELGWMGQRADSGVRMNHPQAIGHPPIWRAITLISRGIAKLPMNVHVIGANGDDSVIDRKHPAHYLVSKKPNANMRAYTWKTSMMYHALLRGNGYSGIVRKGSTPIGLILLDPTKTEPFWSGDTLWYKTEAGGEKRKLPAADVFHVRGVSFDGVQGHDVLQIMANALGMGPAGRKWMSKLLSRGSTAGGMLQLPRELSPDARKKRQEEFDKYQAGLDNAFKTLALEDGSKWVRTMITPQEAAIFDVLGFDTKLVGNAFGIPGHKLGDDGKTSYSSLEQENKAFLEDCLDPWAIEFESEASEKLLTTDELEQGTHEIKMDRTALEVGDSASQADSFSKMVNGGLMYADEARARMSLPPLDDGEGKKLRIPVNLAVDGVIAGAAPADPDAAEETPAEDQAEGQEEDVPPDQPGEDGVTTAAQTKAAGTDPQAMQNRHLETIINQRKEKLFEVTQNAILDRLQRLDKIRDDQLPKLQNKGVEAVDDFWRNHRQKMVDALTPLLPIVAILNGLSEYPASTETVVGMICMMAPQLQSEMIMATVKKD